MKCGKDEAIGVPPYERGPILVSPPERTSHPATDPGRVGGMSHTTKGRLPGSAMLERPARTSARRTFGTGVPALRRGRLPGYPRKHRLFQMAPLATVADFHGFQALQFLGVWRHRSRWRQTAPAMPATWPADRDAPPSWRCVAIIRTGAGQDGIPDHIDPDWIG